MIWFIPIIVFVLFMSCSSRPPEKSISNVTTCQNPNHKIGIVRHPAAADYSKLPGHGKLESLPLYDPSSTDVWQMDVRSSDLTA
jgi:hypothetical protein